MTEEFESLPASHLYKVEDIEIPEDDPWKNDKLYYRQQAFKLQRILDPIKQPFVMTLTASYGMGKTTFLRCWAQDLKNQNIQTVTFNAWETDYSNDAFSAFVSSVLNQLPPSDAKEKVKKKALQIGAALLRKTPALFAKAATKHLLGEEAIKDLKALSLTEEDLAELTESVASEMFDRQEQIQNAVIEFRNTLEEVIAAELNGQLYVFIDELDRCRPSYAVEVLERIKHIFSVKGSKFIIAIDSEQLQNAVKGVYGSEIDSSGYIRKFIDWNQSLSEPKKEIYIDFLADDLFKLKSEEFFKQKLNDRFDEQKFRKTLKLLVDAYGLTLRDIDRYFTYLKLLVESNQDEKIIQIEIYLAAFFKYFFPTKYKTLIEWNGTAFFNNTLFEGAITELVEKFSEKNDGKSDAIETDFAVNVADLIVMMSKKTSRLSVDPNVCVTAKTYEKVTELCSWLHHDWLKETLTTSNFRGVPSIRRGLATLDKILP